MFNTLFSWNICLTLSFCKIHTLNSSHDSSSHFLASPQIHGDWNNYGSFWNPKLGLFSSYLSNFAEIKCYIFNLIWNFCFFLTFYIDLEFVRNTFLLCLFYDSLTSGCIFSESKLQRLGLLLILFIFLFLTESNRQITRLSRKYEPMKTDLYFMGQLGLIFNYAV
jgi:hypothetical protein